MADEEHDEREPEQIRAEARAIWMRLGVAVVIIVGAAFGLGLASGGRVLDPPKGTYDPGTTDPIKAAMPGLRSFVESTRGLDFTGSVPVKVVDQNLLHNRIQERLIPKKQRPFTDHAATDQALGFEPSATGAASAVISPDPRGLYDYTDHTIYLAAGDFTDYHRALLVNLLTVAVDDQNFGLARLVTQAAPNLDALRSADALIAGDATRVELAYVDRQTGSVQKKIRAAHDYDARATTFQQNDLLFPTAAGADFAGQVAEQKGNAGIDDAFRNPPEGTSLILDPSQFLERKAPVTVRAPDRQGPIIDRGTIGQFGLAMLVTQGRSYQNAGEASSWLGDSFITFRSQGRACVLDNMLVSGAVARDQLAAQLRRTLPGATVTLSSVDQSFTLRMCG
ncbi:MAG TPA: hypothetical protein VHC49_20455 [Mycobacteriales bacterium]|nr:hypothetical protein [Mycobacteriales bacterium]